MDKCLWAINMDLLLSVCFKVKPFNCSKRFDILEFVMYKAELLNLYIYWKQPWAILCRDQEKFTEEKSQKKIVCNFCSNFELMLQVSKSGADLQRGWEEAEHERISQKERTRRHQVWCFQKKSSFILRLSTRFNFNYDIIYLTKSNLSRHDKKSQAW